MLGLCAVEVVRTVLRGADGRKATWRDAMYRSILGAALCLSTVAASPAALPPTKAMPKMARPAYLKPFADPVFGATVVRITGDWHAASAAQVGPAGDFNGDGFDDFLVGSQGLPPAHGRLFVILGGEEFPDKIDLSRLGLHGLSIEGRLEWAGMTTPARETGDINGDGCPDFAVAEMGSPGALYVIFGFAQNVPFIRGDADFNQDVNISDAIFTLNYLFLAGEAPWCEDAADADDDGSLLLTDAVYLLRHLFLAGPAPPEPYAEKGEDPTEDGLACLGF